MFIDKISANIELKKIIFKNDDEWLENFVSKFLYNNMESLQLFWKELVKHRLKTIQKRITDHGCGTYGN